MGGLPEIARAHRGQLGLSDEQVSKVEAIFKKRHEALRKIREEVRPRFQEQFDLTRKEVEAVLTEEQAEKWRKHYGQMRRT